VSEAGTLEKIAPADRQRAFVPSPRWLFGLVLPVGAAVLYEITARFGLFGARLLPPPSRVFAALWGLGGRGGLLTPVTPPLLRGPPALTRKVQIDPPRRREPRRGDLGPHRAPVLRREFLAIPSLAWVPLFILWLGIFESSKIALIALGVFFPVYLGVMGAIANVDRKIVEVGRAFRLSRWQLARRILLPAILPDYIVALRSGLGLGFMFVVAAEIMGASEGLGYLLVDGQQLGKPAQILAAILCFAVLGKVLDWLLVLGTKPLLTWQDSFARTV